MNKNVIKYIDYCHKHDIAVTAGDCIDIENTTNWISSTLSEIKILEDRVHFFKDDIITLQDGCKHLMTRTTSDPSGGMDYYVICGICDKEL